MANRYDDDLWVWIFVLIFAAVIAAITFWPITHLIVAGIVVLIVVRRRRARVGDDQR